MSRIGHKMIDVQRENRSSFAITDFSYSHFTLFDEVGNITKKIVCETLTFF